MLGSYKLMELTKEIAHYYNKDKTPKSLQMTNESLHGQSFKIPNDTIITSAITSSNSSSSLNSIRSFEPPKLELFKACSSLASLESCKKVKLTYHVHNLDIIYLNKNVTEMKRNGTNIASTHCLEPLLYLRAVCYRS